MRLKADIRRRLAGTRGFVFDMDGTLVLGDKNNKGLRALPGAARTLNELKRLRVPYVILTNGTVRTPREYAVLLRQAGLAVRADRVLTPASIAGEALFRAGYRRVLVLGGRGVSRPLIDAGLEVVQPREPQPGKIDAIFAGWYREFSMSDLEVACHAVWQGAHLYTASMSLFFATAHGKAIGTSRAICAMITSLTGARARVLGKPSLAALLSASRHMRVPTKDLAVIGDDPMLEVPMAHRGRSLAIAVNSGLGRADAFAHLPRDRHPHITVHSVREFLEVYMDAVRSEQ
jgi:4-nitrophenyl phosphatase